jgi:hypothetical protein
MTIVKCLPYGDKEPNLWVKFIFKYRPAGESVCYFLNEELNLPDRGFTSDGYHAKAPIIAGGRLCGTWL